MTEQSNGQKIYEMVQQYDPVRFPKPWDELTNQERTNIIRFGEAIEDYLQELKSS